MREGYQSRVLIVTICTCKAAHNCQLQRHKLESARDRLDDDILDLQLQFQGETEIRLQKPAKKPKRLTPQKLSVKLAMISSFICRDADLSSPAFFCLAAAIPVVDELVKGLHKVTGLRRTPKVWVLQLQSTLSRHTEQLHG